MDPNPRWRWSVSASADDKQKAYAAILHIQPADFLRSDQTNSGILQCFDGGGGGGENISEGSKEEQRRLSGLYTLCKGRITGVKQEEGSCVVPCSSTGVANCV